MRRNKSGICPKCRRWFKWMQLHHIYPVRWFGKKGPTTLICKDDHFRLEIAIEFEERNGDPKNPRRCLPRGMYFRILAMFLQR